MRHATPTELIQASLDSGGEAAVKITVKDWIYPAAEITATTKSVVSKKYGGTVIETTFRLDGDRIPQSAAQLLLAAYPVYEG